MNDTKYIRPRKETIIDKYNYLNFNPTSFSNKYGIDRRTVAKFVNGDPLPQSTLAAFCCYLGINIVAATHTDDLHKLKV